MSRFRPRDRRTRTTAAVAAAGLLLTGACASPDADAGAYRQSSVAAMQAALSEGRTAELAATQWLDGLSTLAVARVLVHGNETAVSAEADWFGGLEPPRRAADRLRAGTLEAIDATGSAVQEVRIALSRADRPATAAGVGDLARACAELEALSGAAP